MPDGKGEMVAANHGLLAALEQRMQHVVQHNHAAEQLALRFGPQTATDQVSQ